MATVRNTKFGGIVSDGMLLCIDAAKKESYSRSGTQWNDMVSANMEEADRVEDYAGK